MPKQAIELIARGVIKSGSQILVCWNPKDAYGYLPGGHVEFGESSAEALIRECEEEFGTSIQVGPLLLIQEQLFEQRGRSRHEVTVVFHVEHSLSASEPVESKEPYIEFRWLDLAAISTADFRPEEMKRWLLSRGHLSSSASWIPASR